MQLKLGNLTAVLGTQWGDEGKGKLIDILSEEFELVVRAAGGANAGHTIYLRDPSNPTTSKKFVFHLVPSGMLHPTCTCLIGNGVVLHLPTLFEEIELLEKNNISTNGRILIADRTHLLFHYHKLIDGLQEERKGDKKVGTTGRGIGPCYADKTSRMGIRIHELLDFEKFETKFRQNFETLKKLYKPLELYSPEEELSYLKKLAAKIKPMLVDGAHYLHEAYKNGRKILVEGANGSMLDVDHGTYPFVTSSNPTIGGISTGTGLPGRAFTSLVGIMKAYVTRVGSGPFPTELKDQLGEDIRQKGGEFGATTGRPRRCGWYDSVIGKYAVMLNGLTDINLTKLDVLTGLETLKIATAYKYNGQVLPSVPADLDIMENMEIEYLEMPGWTENIGDIRSFEDLPQNAKNYVLKIEELIGCKISSIGVGLERDAMIFR
ncbi:adenylosuccinate synthase [Candidatus Gracilibacteria bacterium]|nr:adenylosuccinate synthase [Candidatus Gracilibacteria bacterium]